MEVEPGGEVDVGGGVVVSSPKIKQTQSLSCRHIVNVESCRNTDR